MQGRISETQEHFRESTEYFKTQLSSLVENSITTMQKDMEKEIDNAMSSIGGALTEINKRIVEEYNKIQKYNG